MEVFNLNLMDLVPKEAEFSLSTHPGKIYKLEAWSLYWRTWASEKYSDQGLGEIFNKQKIVEIGHMAYNMLIDKSDFATEKDFLKAVASMQDQVNLIKALLASVGMGEPEIEKLTEEAKRRGLTKTAAPGKEPVNPQARRPRKNKTGARSSTR